MLKPTIKRLDGVRVELPQPISTRDLEDEAGVLGRFGARLRTQGERARALADIRRDDYRSAVRIARTSRAIAEVQITGVLAAEGLASIAALASEVNARTGAAAVNATAAAAAERIAHVDTRVISFDAIAARELRGGMTADEANALRALAHNDLAENLESANRRKAATTEAIETLNQMALAGLSRAAKTSININ